MISVSVNLVFLVVHRPVCVCYICRVSRIQWPDAHSGNISARTPPIVNFRVRIRVRFKIRIRVWVRFKVRVKVKDKVMVGMVLGLGYDSLHQYSGGVQVEIFPP